MRSFDAKALGDWILIAASVGVIGAVVLSVVLAAYPRSIGSGPADGPPDSVSAARSEPMGERDSGVSSARRAELRAFVEQHCPVCHGTHLAGSIGPPLEPVALEHLGVDALAFAILYGRLEKGMPPWEADLSEADAYWIAGYLKQDGRAE